MHENSILLFLRIYIDRCKNLILNIFRWEEKNWIMSVEKNKKEKEKKSHLQIYFVKKKLKRTHRIRYKHENKCNVMWD